MSMRVHVFLSVPYNKTGVTYSCGEVIKGISESPLFSVTLAVPRLNVHLDANIEVRQVLPLWNRWPFPFSIIKSIAEYRMAALLRKLSVAEVLNESEIFYIWGGVCDAYIEAMKEIRRRGAITIFEATNCAFPTIKRILDDAYIREEILPNHGITEEAAQHENRFLSEIDYIFCSSELVVKSYLEYGSGAIGKCLRTNYGWNPSRLAQDITKVTNQHNPTFVFVGSIGIRKGAHLLLRYWVRSGVKGVLVLAGKLEATVGRLCADHLKRDDIVMRGYVEDIGSVYRSADVFVFPTLEEGAPLVTYEAAGCSLPVVTSPMGAAGIIQDDVNGYIIDPYDAERWIETLRRLADSAALRRRLGKAAKESAREFTWSQVGDQRRQLLLEVTQDRPRP